MVCSTEKNKKIPNFFFSFVLRHILSVRPHLRDSIHWQTKQNSLLTSYKYPAPMVSLSRALKPPDSLGRCIHVCCEMIRWTWVCLSSIMSLFSISCWYCKHGVCVPPLLATKNARKPPLSRQGLSCVGCYLQASYGWMMKRASRTLEMKICSTFLKKCRCSKSVCHDGELVSG